MALNPALSFYRRMVKTLRLKFEGDIRSYSQFRYAIKMETLSNQHERDPVKISKLIFDLDIAREWLVSEVMRADLQQDGKYKLKINQGHLQNAPIKPVRNPHYFLFKVPDKLVDKTSK
jgi:hypothetical protein